MNINEMEDNPLRNRRNNYGRVLNLIMDLGTEVIRTEIVSELGESLIKVLGWNGVEEKLSGLYNRKTGKPLINSSQWKILYPPPHQGIEQHVDVYKVDITLWVLLMEYLIPIAKEAQETREDRSVDEARAIRDGSWKTHAYALRTIRNELCHLTPPELNDLDFGVYWDKATKAIKGINPNYGSFNSYLKDSFDENEVKLYYSKVREEMLEDNNSDLHGQIRHLRRIIKCSFGMFLSLFIISALSAYLIVYFIKMNKPCQRYRYSNSTNKGAIHVVSRYGWEADYPTSDLSILTKPAKYLIYTHTADTAPCRISEDCCVLVKGIQYSHMHREIGRFADIGFHYLIDSGGLIYEGRSLEYMPAAALGWNNHTISVALIGNYMYIQPTGEIIGALDTLVTWLVLSNILEKEYIMYAMCEVRPTDSPGKNLYDEINRMGATFPRVQHRNDTFCYFNHSMLAAFS